MLAPLSAALECHGIRVATPTVAGHGTSVADLAQQSLADWIQSVETPFLENAATSGPCTVGGISLGGLLALELALRHPHWVKRIVLLSTPLVFPLWMRVGFPLLHHTPLRAFFKGSQRKSVGIGDPEAAKNFECYDFFPAQAIANIFSLQKEVAQGLHRIQAPVLAVHSPKDATAPIRSLDILRHRLPPHSLTCVVLEKSEHIITLDVERERVASSCLSFIQSEP